MFQLGKILVLSIVAGFGTAATAANAVSNNLAMFQILPGLAMGYATLTVTAQCVGAGDYEQVRYYKRRLIRMNIRFHFDQQFNSGSLSAFPDWAL